jgi:hypothetical protein
MHRPDHHHAARFRAAQAIASASSTVEQSGFSTSTMRLPARSAAMVWSAWNGAGLPITTISTDVFAIKASKLGAANAPHVSAVAAVRSGWTSQIARTAKSSDKAAKAGKWIERVTSPAPTIPTPNRVWICAVLIMVPILTSGSMFAWRQGKGGIARTGRRFGITRAAGGNHHKLAPLGHIGDGVATPDWGRLVCHKTLPFSASKARNCRSKMVAPINSRPLAVTMGPP